MVFVDVELPAAFELADGVRYVRSTPLVLAILLMLAVSSLLGMPYSTLMPAYTVERLGGDSHTLGFMVAATGLGALAAALYLASRRSVPQGCWRNA